MFGMLAVFGEFEREMIVARVNAGMARAKTHGTKSGRPIGRPKVSKAVETAVRAELAKGTRNPQDGPDARDWHWHGAEDQE